MSAIAPLGPLTSVCGPPTSISTRSCDSAWTSNGSSGRIHCDAVNVSRDFQSFGEGCCSMGKLPLALATCVACLFAQEGVDEATDAQNPE
jgi:hypothetical protein